MKDLTLAVILVVLVVVGFGGAGGAAYLWQENRGLSRELARVGASGAEASVRMRELEERVKVAGAAAEQLQLRAEGLESELKGVRAAVGETTTNEPARAVRSAVFLNGEQLGEAWVLPARLKEGGKGVAAYSVLLDDAVRARIAGADRAKATPAQGVVMVNNNFEQPHDAGLWPVYYYYGWGGHPDRPPVVNPPPKPPTPPGAGGGGNGSSGIWRPTGKPFLPAPSTWPIVTPPQSMPQPRVPAVPGGGIRVQSGK